MAISEFETRRYEKLANDFIEKRRPPPHLRSKLDLGCRVEDQSLELYEIRPHWETGKLMDLPFAKATYTKTRKVWRVYWRRADGKWHPYDPVQQVDTLEEFLKLVDADEYACFFG